MSNLTIVNDDLPDFLQNAGVSELTKSLMGKTSTGVKRIVPKNGIFTKEIGGKPMGKIKGDVNVVIINSSPKVGRIFYANAWTPDAEPTAPDCFSNDGNSPDAGSTNKQAERCDDCERNIKGSGQGNSKACRYSRRIAVMLEDDFGTPLEGDVYQMNLASKTLFGQSPAENTHMFENYVKYLGNNGKSLDWYITKISFNEENNNASQLFTPVEHIKRHQYDVISKIATTPAVVKMVTMTPYQADMSGRTPSLEVPKSFAKPVAAKEDDIVEEPKKRESKKADPAPTPKKNLDSVIAAWADEE